MWLSFDDGWKELAEVLPLVRRLHLPVTLFIPSGVVGGDGRFPWLSQCRASELLGASGCPESRFASAGFA